MSVLSFDQLISELIEANKISGFREYTILDLGCCFPEAFFKLYHNFGFKQYTGIDKKSETLRDGDDYIKPDWKTSYNGSESIYSLYQERLSELRFIPKTIKEFNSIFHFEFNINILEFLEKTPCKYDLVNLTMVLHFFNPSMSEMVLNKIKRDWLKPHGLVCLRVLKYNKVADANGYYTYSSIRCQNLENHFKSIIKKQETDKIFELIGKT